MSAQREAATTTENVHNPQSLHLAPNDRIAIVDSFLLVDRPARGFPRKSLGGGPTNSFNLLTSASFCFNSHCQTVRDFQPSAAIDSAWNLSLATFFLNFVIQNFRLVFGTVASRQPS